MRFTEARTKLLAAAALILAFAVGPTASGAGLTCREVFSPPQDASHLSPKWWDLLLQQSIDARKYTTSEIKKMNRTTREKLESVMPVSDGRATTISYAELSAALENLRNHPMTRPEDRTKYQPDDVDIGYCFGRATYMHLLLLRMGLDKNAVAKVWAVGPQKSDREKNWGFHVAVAVRVRGYGWMTVDSNIFKIQPLQHWFDSHQEKSVDGKMRIYVTEADKFGVSTGRYDRIQMGLDLKREDDWYRGYFNDMLATLRGRPLEELGVPRIEVVMPPPEPKKKQSLLDRWLFGS